MKVVQINTTCGVGSTGKICVGISQELAASHVENRVIYSSKTSGYSLGVPASNDKYIKIQALKSRIWGNYGFNSQKATRKMIGELQRIMPDIVHLHNIHGHDCDLELLFTYFKENKIKLIWTFHDCWAFTGYCPHFTMMKCDQWRTQCSQCIQRREYSWFWDKSRILYQKKKHLFEGLDLTIITPSQWLSDMVRQSFLKDYPVLVINNGIDLAIFQPTQSNFRQTYGLQNRKIVLGVSFDWGERKGFDVFVDLAQRLSDDYRIVLVGTDPKTEKRLPNNVLSIHRTQNQQELAEIYTAADVFVNPTREENYPTVNMEALACGIPVITFKTGGSPEMLDETCGAVVECDDVETLEKEIIRICTDKPYSEMACVGKAQSFDKNKKYKEYIDLYERVVATRDKRG